MHAFTEKFGLKPTAVAVAPGRVEVLGNHTDYNGGFILSAAIDKYTGVAIAPQDGDLLTIFAADMNETSEQSTASLNHDAVNKWADYPVGVISEILRLPNTPKIGGAKLAIHSDVPLGAGLSSSAALEVSTALAVQHLDYFYIGKMELAQLCQRAENQFVGVSSGLMDQFSSVFGERNSLLFLDCRSLAHSEIPLRGTTPVKLVVCNSMVKHALTGGEYNSRRAECMSAAKKLGHELLRDVTAEALEAGKDKLTELEYKRARHIVTENDRVLKATHAAASGDMQTLGQLMSESHASSRDNFENSTKELDKLVEIARSLAGCFGARLTGGGFGGAVLALVDANKADEFCHNIADQYGAWLGKTPDVFECQVSAGARVDAVQ